MSDASPVSAAYLTRIDAAHANAGQAWKEMGEPHYLKDGDVARLQAASRMDSEPRACRYAERTVHVDVDLPPHAVAAVRLEFADDVTPPFTHLFAKDSETLEEAFATARPGMQEEGLVWASWPKNSSANCALPTGLHATPP